jgi:predicted nucleic acid-binding protein
VTYLLDTSALVSGIWTDHESHLATKAWLQNKSVMVCPLSALGFLRISTHQAGPFKASMPEARRGLAAFLAERKAGFIPDDLPALDSHPARSGQVTDAYLADLAQSHDLRLATLDQGIDHPAVDVITA